MRKQDKRQLIEEANKRLLGESFHEPDGTPIGVDGNHMPIVKEDHEHSDEGKISYITQALNNLNSEDLDKIYLSVERYDPEYKPNIAKGNYRQSSEPGEEVKPEYVKPLFPWWKANSD